MPYNLEYEATEIKKLNEAIKKGKAKGSYGKSKLRKYQTEILKLRDNFDLTFSEIVLWLKLYRKIKVSRSSVSSFYYSNRDK